MKGLLITIALCLAVVAGSAIPSKRRIGGRIGGGELADGATARHACIVLVFRDDIEGEDQVAIGGGSIVARNRVVTAAHVVRGFTQIQVGFYIGTTLTRRDSNFAQNENSFDVLTFEGDLAIIRFTNNNAFPAANVIPCNNDPALPEANTALRVVSFGFTTPDQNMPEQFAYESPQTVVVEEACTEVNGTATHFCAMDDTSVTFICPGDNGSGIFLTTPGAAGEDPTNLLMGVVSLIIPGCVQAEITAYTRIGQFVLFLQNQDVAVETLAEEPVTP